MTSTSLSGRAYQETVSLRFGSGSQAVTFPPELTFITGKQLDAMLGIKPRTRHRWMTEGKLPRPAAHSTGRMSWFRLSEVAVCIEKLATGCD